MIGQESLEQFICQVSVWTNEITSITETNMYFTPWNATAVTFTEKASIKQVSEN